MWGFRITSTGCKTGRTLETSQKEGLGSYLPSRMRRKDISLNVVSLYNRERNLLHRYTHPASRSSS